jgi:hypothetical protein
MAQNLKSRDFGLISGVFLGSKRLFGASTGQILLSGEDLAANWPSQAISAYFLGKLAEKSPKKVCAVTVIVRTFLRYSSLSDIFGLAYLVGQIED